MALSLDDEEMFGWSMIGFVCGIFVLNLMVIVAITIITLKRSLYLRKLKNAHLKQIKPVTAVKPIDQSEDEEKPAVVQIVIAKDETVLPAIDEVESDEDVPDEESENKYQEDVAEIILNVSDPGKYASKE